MEKVAIIELNPNYVKMQQVEVEKNKYFNVYKEILTPIDIFKNFKPENFIKVHAVEEILETLRVYKAVVDREDITKTFCIYDRYFNNAKNFEGILNEIHNISTFEFEEISPEKEMNYIYSAIINSFNKPKGVILNIADYETSFLVYNRRMILETKTIPFGKVNLLEKFKDEDDKFAKIYNFIKNEFTSDLINENEFHEDWEIIGAGAFFRNLGVVSRKGRKFPVDIEHNYEMTLDDVSTVFNAVKDLDLDKNCKIKGISNVESMSFASGISILQAILDICPKKNFAVSQTGFEDGILFNYTLPLIAEKPITDNLGYSLQVACDFYDKPGNALHVYKLCLTLFKLFKVIHRLNRSYLRILRIASYLCNCGERVNFKDRAKASFNIIENTPLYGVTQSEIILACFVAKYRDADNFSMAEWVRYKDVTGGVDLDIVKKLASLLRISEALDITKFGVVEDIDCDILGDCFVLRLITKGNASLEIKHAKLAIPDFKKAFGKSIEFM